LQSQLTKKIQPNTYKYLTTAIKVFLKILAVTSTWLSGKSLKISCEEHVRFLEQFLGRTFPVKKHAYETAKEILRLVDQSLPHRRVLGGKAGSGSMYDNFGILDEHRQGVRGPEETVEK
jgi:beta-lactamase class D